MAGWVHRPAFAFALACALAAHSEAAHIVVNAVDMPPADDDDDDKPPWEDDTIRDAATPQTSHVAIHPSASRWMKRTRPKCIRMPPRCLYQRRLHQQTVPSEDEAHRPASSPTLASAPPTHPELTSVANADVPWPSADEEAGALPGVSLEASWPHRRLR